MCSPPPPPPSPASSASAIAKIARKCCKSLIIGSLILCYLLPKASAMSEEERQSLRDESRDMFYHGYYAYLYNAFPADELMPLSCRGRFRGREPNRGDIDDALGNFSLTLIDSLDTMVVMGGIEDFEHGVRLVIDHVTFDRDVSVSVFETNIRVVGGLISAHILSEMIRDKFDGMSWYKGELLNMALDIGYRLLPAFNTSTGLPHPRVNLRYGIKSGKIKNIGETCTACAGTMILEFAALSRLSGGPIFEEKASHAMDVLWSSRHRMSNLVGNVLNINTGDWVRRDSGIGAGIDSYYEYVAKAYILLGEDKYLNRWETHYSAIMKYLSIGNAGPLLQDVHMHRPSSVSKHFVDALGAFWPGLQVLMGDVKPAVESHEVLYQVMKRHNFIPEAFTTDFQVHWGQHLLRPEFVESTYMLFRATGDPYYLEVGKNILESLQKHARVTCGYATIKDVRTLQKEDRMDSFVLAETFKYLYLLFARDEDLIIDIDNFVFTTEAHFLPLSLARLSNVTAVPLRNNNEMEYDEDVEYSRSCPSTEYLFPGKSTREFAGEFRKPLANVVMEKCPVKKPILQRKLTGVQFQSTDPEHLRLVKDMGITLVALPDGRVQLLHSSGNAKTPEDAEEGLLFMHEMIELLKQQMNQPETLPRIISFKDINNEEKVIYAGPAQFGRELVDGFSVKGEIIISTPIKACTIPTNAKRFWGKIAIVERGDCMFVEKARMIESMGAKGGVVIDNNEGTSAKESPLFAMSGDGTDDVSIPMVFLFKKDATVLLNAIKENPKLEITLRESPDEAVEAKKDEVTEDATSYDFTAPVASFLEKSRKQVEHYFKGSNAEDEEILDKNNKGVVIMRTLNEDEVKELNAIQNNTQGEDEGSEAKIEDIDDDDENMEEFLSPSIQKSIKHKVLKNDKLLNDLLKVKFGDLVNLFQKLILHYGSLEGAYMHLFELIEKRGSENLSEAFSEEFVDDDETLNGIVKDLLGDVERSVGSLLEMSEEEVKEILNKYLEALQNEDKVKVSGVMDLMEVLGKMKKDEL